MATSADRDDRDDDEKNKAADEAPPKKKGDKAAPSKEAASKEAAAKPTAPAERADEEDEEDEDEEGEDEEEDEEEDEAKPAAKSASKSAAKSASAGSKAASKAAASKTEDDDEDEEEEEEEPAPRRPAARGPGARGPGARGPGARSARGPGAVLARQAPAGGGGSLGKSVGLFFGIVIALGGGFAYFGREPSAEQAKPKWTQGQVVDVEVTLVRSDRQDLACAAADEIAGKHCAFEAKDKPWSKGGDVNDDKKILKPYTTLDRIQFTAAGLWAEPALAADKLPATRFSVKCKYKVEGTLKNVGVRWEQTGNWFPNNEWYAGSISGCTLSL